MQPQDKNPANSPEPPQHDVVVSEPPQGVGIKLRVDAASIYPSGEKPAEEATISETLSKKSERSFFKKARLIIVVLLLTLVGVTYFTKNDYRNVSSFVPETLNDPSQAPTNATEFNYEHKGYSYTVTPLFEYELSGMVVSRKDYEKVRRAEDRADNTLFPTDLCMIWDENLKNGSYMSDSTTFSQNARWCTWQWQEGAAVVNEAAANSHLMFTDEKVKAKLRGIGPGDQIKITGKLVNVHNTDSDIPPQKTVVRNTSTVRTDSGDQACEDIWVENIEILRKNVNFSEVIFRASLITLGAIVLVSVTFGIVQHYRHPKDVA